MAATPSLALTVSTEQAPAGGWAQFKVTAVTPDLVSSGSISMDFDPSVFGNIAEVAVFSATGDATGYANVNAQHVDVHFTSASGGIAQLPALPVFTVSIPVLAGVAPGTTSAVTLDPTGSAWNDNQGNTYSVTVTAATFTVGGTLSVASVTPGGAYLPAGTVLQIAGAGFDSTTSVAIDGVAVASQTLVSSGEIDVTLGGGTDLTGKHFYLNDGSAAVDYFSALPSVSAALLSGFSPTAGVQLILPEQTYSVWEVGDNDSDTSSNNDSLALLNQTTSPVTVTLLEISNDGIDSQQSFVIPAGTLYLFEATNLVNVGVDNLWIQTSEPIRMLEYTLVIQLPPPNRQVLTTPYPPNYPIPLRLSVPGSIIWNWQIGTPQPSPSTLGISGSLAFTVSTTGETWLSVTPSSGTAPATLTVTPNIAGLAPGSYKSTITITPAVPAQLAGFTAAPSQIVVVLTVTPAVVLPQISASGPTPFTYQIGSTQPNPGLMSIASSGPSLPFAITVSPGADWLTVSTMSGATPAEVTVTANGNGQQPGIYTADITIQGPNNTVTQFTQLTVNSDTLSCGMPMSAVLAAGTPPPQSNPLAPVEITPFNAVLTGVTAATQSGGNWLTAQIGANYPNLPNVIVSVGAVGIAPGVYQGTVTVNSSNYGSCQTTVNLTVLGTPTAPTVTPASISVTVPAGQTVTQSLSVGAVGSPVLVKLSGTADFFSAIRTSYETGSQYLTPLGVTLSIGEQQPGAYFGTIQIIWAGGTVTVPVAIYVSATAAYPPSLSTIVNGASLMPAALAPGELFTLTGAGLGAAPAGLALDSSGKVSTTLNNTQVLVNGVAAPLVYSSSGQMNAVVPYEAGASGIATIQVKSNNVMSAEWGVPLAPSAPGIFTLGATGLGQAAVVNQDGSINGAGSPAARGSVIQVYATGAGLTQPAGVTGSVTSGAIAPVLPVTAQIAGMNAQVMFAGLAPTDVSGVLQVNVVVPAGVIPGAAIPIVIAVGGTSSQAGVTIAVE